MKHNFLTGLILLLPAALTFLVVSFLLDLLTNPFLSLTESFLHHVSVAWCRLFILLILATVTLFTGFLAHRVFSNYFFSLVNAFIVKIPLVNRIYQTAQDGVNALFQRDEKAKVKVVLVPYPSDNVYCLGMMPSESIHSDSDSLYHDKVSVCVIGSPNPTLGFMLLYPKSQVVTLEMSVEELLKFLISCGMTPFNGKIR